MEARKIFNTAASMLLTLSMSGRTAVSEILSEKKLSEQIASSVRKGEPIWLNLDQHTFLAIFLEAQTRKTRGAVLIVPGGSEHADSEGLVRSLRTTFAAHGFDAVSLQMPVRDPALNPDSDYSWREGAGIRIRSAVEYLKARNIKNIVVIGHGVGAWMALDYWMTDPKPEATALVLVGMSAFNDDPRASSRVEALKNLRIPVLDIFGDRDLRSVVDSAGLRRQWMKQNEAFRQLEIHGAEHGLHAGTDWVFKRIYGWVVRQARRTDAGK